MTNKTSRHLQFHFQDTLKVFLFNEKMPLWTKEESKALLPGFCEVWEQLKTLGHICVLLKQQRLSACS